MNIKIKTLVIVEGEREVPLTKSIVNQLPYFDGNRYRTGDALKAIGTVETSESVWVLIDTPDCGLTRISQFQLLCTGLKSRIAGSTERIILLK